MAGQYSFDLQKLRHRGHDVLSTIEKNDLKCLNAVGAGNASASHKSQARYPDTIRAGVLPQNHVGVQQSVGRPKRYPEQSTGSTHVFFGTPSVAKAAVKFSCTCSSVQICGWCLQSEQEPLSRGEPAYLQPNWCRSSSLPCPCTAVGNSNGPVHYEDGAIFATVPMKYGEHPLIQTFFINLQPVRFHESDNEQVVYSL